jgi:hypothetical protein
MAKDKEKEPPVVESMADKRAREEEEARAFKKKYPKVINTIDTLLQGFSGKEKGLIDGLLEDFAPTDPKKKPGISARSVLKLIGYGFRNPGKIGDLLSIARNPAILQNKTFQQEVLKSESTWKFVGMLGEENRLPKIGQALANFGVKEFEKGNILDQDSLVTLNPLIKEANSRDTLKKIANQFMDPAFDQNKNINEIVDLMLKPGPVANYLHQKKDSLKNYIVTTTKSMIENENLQAQKKYYEELKEKGITVITPEHIKEAKAQVGNLQKQLDTYGIKTTDLNKLAEIVPILMDKPEDLKKFYDSYAKGDYNGLVKDVLEMSATNDEVKKYLKENAGRFQEIMVNGAKAVAQTHLDTYGISYEALKKITDLMPVLLDKPEDLKKFYELYSEASNPKDPKSAPDYNKLIKEILEMSATNDGVKDYLKKNAKVFQEIMVNGAKAVAQTHLDTYGVSDEALKKITDLVPVLLDKPEDLKKFYELYSEASNPKDPKSAPDYNKLIKEILEMSATNDGVKDYLKKNAKVFQEIMVNGAFATPSVEKELKKYGVDKEKLSKITNIVPILLDDPAALKKFYNSFEKGDFIGLGKDLLELSKKNKAVDEYLKNNNDIFKGIVGEVVKSTPILKQLGVKSDLVDLFSPLLTSKNADKVQGLISLYEEAGKADPKKQTGKYIELAINLCKLLEEDPELSKQLNNNRGDLGKIAQNVIDNIPFLKGYLGEMKVDELASNIIKDPKGLREGIEAYQKGGKALAWGAGKLIVNKVMDPEFRGAVIKGVGTWLLGDGNIKQQVVDHAMKMIPGDSKTRINLKELAGNAIENLDKPDPKKLKEVKNSLEKNQLFTGINIKNKMENMEISSINFSNSTFLLNASFAGSVLTDVNFEGTKFTRINFEGTEIDGKTLATLTEQLKNNSVSLKGVKIIGDIPKGTDLSHVDFSGADLSGVTSMKDINLKGADLSKATLPKDNTIIEEAKNVVMYTEKELSQIEKLADNIAVNLFGKNHGRTDSAELIKMSLKEVFGKLKTEDKDLDLVGYLEENMKQLAGKNKNDGLSKLYYASKSTTSAGLVTGWVGIEGIYLDKKKVLGEEFIAKLDQNIQNGRKPLEEMSKSNDSLTSKKPTEQMSKFNESIESIPETSLSESELKKIERLTNKIVENLFGKGHARKKDGELIKESLQEAFKELKKQNNNVDITGIIGQNMDKLVGKVNPGYLSTSGDGLSLLYYKNSSYTTAGLTTGGVYLDSKKIQAKEFAVNLKSHIEKDVGKEMKKKGIVKDVNVDKSYIGQNTKSHKSTPNLTKRESTRQVGN